jgi:hypothetical protein
VIQGGFAEDSFILHILWLKTLMAFAFFLTAQNFSWGGNGEEVCKTSLSKNL